MIHHLMNATTRAILLAINRRFYEHHAESFSATRQRPWGGWQRALEAVRSRQEASVLDVGCGNGRLAACLADHPKTRWHYFGIDNSPSLLEVAEQRLVELAGADGSVIAGWELRRVEATPQKLDEALGERSFDLITLFGVLHHVPGLAERLALLGSLARRLAPRGALVLSLWRFDRDPSWPRKHLPWVEYNREAEEAVDLSQLEDGDHLLTWAGDRRHPRYCHLADEDEAARWLAELGRVVPALELVDRFDADGRSGRDNHYLVLRAGDI